MGRHRQRTAITLAAVAAACLLVGATSDAASPRGRALKPGDKAPDLRLPTAAGSTLALSDLRGEVILVDFWASWCAPCQASFPALSDLHAELHDRGFEVVAVNVDERRDDADAFLAARPHAMPVVFDPAGDAPSAFGVSAMPTSFLLDRDGRVRFVHVGYTSKTIDAYRREIDGLLAERTSR
ncbi:MAG: TlpA family protein disulfide reductase [Bacteroidales bacterium]